ncbi:DUF2075 domain-containing protein [Bifidobacterium simiarum]|nr:DUF2075 domain-containing protein [Bifidobacterium simiarum]
MNFEGLAPIIINLPYGRYDKEDFEWAVDKTLDSWAGNRGDYSEMERAMLRYVLAYPTVYVVYSRKINPYSSKNEYTVYVGETNDIRHRTAQHLELDSKNREDWKAVADAVSQNDEAYKQYVISHPKFNKSLTLDVENRLMHYMSSTDSVKKLNNRRTNAQGDYYTSDQFDHIFSQIWLKLHKDDPDLFPAEEIIRDSALFKASPFHKLSDSQLEAEEAILTQLAGLLTNNRRKNSVEQSNAHPKLIFVQGAAGTGKTVLLSHLFYRIATEIGIQERTYSGDEDYSASPEAENGQLASYILVNHKEQVHVYNQIATKLGLQKKSSEVVMLPSQFINRFSVRNERGRGIPDQPRGMADIVLIDEAHLLMTQGNQGYSGKNQLYDILRRARVVIAVFDPNQIMQSSQQWDPVVLRKLQLDEESINKPHKTGTLGDFRSIVLSGGDQSSAISVDVTHIHLEKQFRIAANESMIRWIDRFASGLGIDPLPTDPGEYTADGAIKRAPYDVKVFDSPIELFEAIRKKAQSESDGWNSNGLSRLLATYDWKYSAKSVNMADPQGFWNVELHRDSSGVWRMGSGDVFGRSGIDSHVFCKPWNYQLADPADPKTKGIDKDLAWAEKPYTINEIGSIFTIQGFDLNYAGVIIGPSVTYRRGRIVFDKSASRNYLATNKRKDLGDFAEENLKHELNVLLKRGVHGLYLFAVDEELQQRLKECCTK